VIYLDVKMIAMEMVYALMDNVNVIKVMAEKIVIKGLL